MNSSPIEPVVAAVDGTLSSARAVDLAAEEAAARVAPLVVVYTVEPGGDPALLPGHRRLLDLMASRAEAEHPGLSVGVDLVSGEPVEALVRWSAQACLLVVGHCGDEYHRRSVAAEVASRSAAPVIVYRPLSVYEMTDSRPVLIGVAGRPGEQAPFRFAFEEAELRGAPVVACYVRAPRYVFPAADPFADAPTPAESQDLLTAALDGWPARYPDVEVRMQVLYGRHVVDVLAHASRAAGLTVVGANPQRALDYGCLGPVARGLIDIAGCPVAVVSGTRPARLEASTARRDPQPGLALHSGRRTGPWSVQRPS